MDKEFPTFEELRRKFEKISSGTRPTVTPSVTPRRSDGGKRASSSWNTQTDETVFWRGTSSAMASPLDKKTRGLAQYGDKQTLYRSSHDDQVRKEMLEPEVKTKLRSKVQPTEAHHPNLRRTAKTGRNSAENVSLSNEQSCISSDGMHTTSGTGSKESQSVSSPRRLPERMRRRSKKIKNGEKEYGSIHKLPLEETVRFDEKMIVKKCLSEHPIADAQDSGLKEKVLLVMGATGAGKSTLINGMVNYIMGVEWEDGFRFKLVNEKPSSQAHSVTKEITAYTIYPMNGSAVPYKFTIVDTPGFGDTGGFQRDLFITKQIKEFFSLEPPEGIDHVDGIGFVAQASLPRLTPTQKYIFDSILSIFGKDVKDNFFMMATFADGHDPPVLEAIKIAKITYKSFFKFNNSALFANNTNAGFDQLFWQMGHASLKDFLTEFGKTSSVSLQLTNQVLKEREQLETLVEGLNRQIKTGLAKMEEMRKEKQILERHEVDIENNSNFEETVPKLLTHEVDLKGTGRNTTTCLGCNFTCHNDCQIADDDSKDGCVAMDSDGNCKVCTGKCWWQRHRNVPYLIEYQTVYVKVTYEELKAKYDKAVQGKSRVETMIAMLGKAYENLRLEVVTSMYEARVCVHRLDEITLKPNSLTELEYIKLLIETEKEEHREGYEDRIKAYQTLLRNADLLDGIKHVDEIPELLEKLLPREEATSHTSRDLRCVLL